MSNSSDAMRNLSTDTLNEWNWDPRQPMESLDMLRNECIQCAVSICDWYNRKKYWKQTIAKWLRITAIVISGISALLLLWSQQKPTNSSAWATGAMVIAGTMVAVDRFFGYTNAWIRFIETANLLRSSTRRFKLNWEEQKTQWPDSGPTTEQIESALKLGKDFVLSIDSIVTTEINEWATQFRASVTRSNSKIGAALDQLEPDSIPNAPAGRNQSKENNGQDDKKPNEQTEETDNQPNKKNEGE